MTSIAIIGAGLAGLTLARRLKDTAQVTVFEKARGVGGRMATRYVDAFEFDHGAQFFTAKTDAFRAFLAPHIETGAVAPWPAEIASIGGARLPQSEKFVGAPRMNSLCKALAADLDIRLQTRPATLTKTGAQWRLTDEAGAELGAFDWVVSTAPAAQTAALAPEEFAHRSAIDRSKLAGCFTLMLGFDDLPALPFAAARIADAPVGWVCDQRTKPGRNGSAALVIQSSNDWAEQNLDTDRDQIERILIAEASTLTGIDLTGAAYKNLHRWLYAATTNPAGAPYLLDDRSRFAVCGDWLIGARIEAAFSSVNALADALG